jgi:hypothetical protein
MNPPSSAFELVLFLHSLLRWGVILSGVLVLLQGAIGLFVGGELGALGKRMQLIFMICIDVQLLLGLALWALSPTVAQGRADMSAAMKDPQLRFWVVEHGLTMLLALVAVHVGRMLVRKAANPRAAHLRTALYSGLALALIFLRTPWPFANVSRPWLYWPF